jgi:hypothetical protein
MKFNMTVMYDHRFPIFLKHGLLFQDFFLTDQPSKVITVNHNFKLKNIVTALYAA